MGHKSWRQDRIHGNNYDYLWRIMVLYGRVFFGNSRLQSASRVGGNL
jgi:hypothetical protein